MPRSQKIGQLVGFLALPAGHDEMVLVNLILFINVYYV